MASDGSTDKFVGRITALTTGHNNSAPNRAIRSTMVDQNRRVMEYLRHPEYDDITWTKLLGMEADPKFIAWVGNQTNAIPLAPSKLPRAQDCWRFGCFT